MRLRKLSRRELFLLALLAVGGVVLLRGWGDPDTGPVTLARTRREEPLRPVPRIGLDRLETGRAESNVGRRDLFAFGTAPSPEEDDIVSPPTPLPQFTPSPPAADPSGSVVAARLPPLNLKFIGAVGNSKGVKVAVLLTDRNEVLTGQQGDVVANRYRIERIGIESVDLADVGTGQSRRIPLKGN